MNGPIRNPGEKLNRVWTHTLSVFAFLAAVVTIIGFFGFHPSNDKSATKPAVPKTSNSPELGISAKKSDPSEGSSGNTVGKTPKSNGTGTLHLDGSFAPGEPMVTSTAEGPGLGIADVTLTSLKNGKPESFAKIDLPVQVEPKHLVSVWHKGTRFVRGIRITSGSPVIRLSFPGLPDTDISTDADGRLLSDLAWPTDRLFTCASIPGPLVISGLTLDGGITFGDAKSNEPGRTLPMKFSLDVPRPGEVLGAIKGQFSFTAKSGRVSVEAISKSGEVSATWSTALGEVQPAALRDTRSDIVSREMTSLRIVYSKDSG